MSNISNIIEERASNIGNFFVGRLLPFIQKRMVGPFIFVDHMGPAAMTDFENLDVPPHPHIGLATITYLFEGAIMHRDSLGSALEIKPGAVNLMVAGRGVTHSERTPDRLRTSEKSLHGLQIWVALPKALEDTEPSFSHTEAQDIPAWAEEGVLYKLIVGALMGKESPVPVLSPMYLLEVKAEQTTTLVLGQHLYGESAIYILEGSVQIEGASYGAKQMLVAKDAQLCSFEIKEGSVIYIFGGEAFPEPRHILWNFVHSDKSVIEQAKQMWIRQEFPKVPGETEWVPLPSTIR